MSKRKALLEATKDLLWRRGYAATSPSRTYDVAPDGHRFIMIKPDQTVASSLILIQHFDEELKRLAPPSGSR